jgi:hypothetical protein
MVHNTTITSHYATHLQKAATHPAMIQRFTKNYQCSEMTFDLVDWQAHHSVLQKLCFADKKFVTKFIHQLWPMGDIFHKIDPTQSAICSSCQLHTELEAHLLQCPQHRDVMGYFLNITLPQFLAANHTCPKLGQCLSSMLSSQICETEPKFGARHGCDELACHALICQLVQDCFSRNWSRLQADLLDQHNHHLKWDRKYYTGNTWLQKRITLLWTTIHASWDHRNFSHHGINKEENHAIRHAHLLLSTQALYAEAPCMMLAADCDPVAEPIADRMKKIPCGLELCLNPSHLQHRQTQQEGRSCSPEEDPQDS